MPITVDIMLAKRKTSVGELAERVGTTPANLTVTNAFAALRLLPLGDRDKDIEILALRHQIAVLERQHGANTRVRFAPEDRALLAAFLTSLPREALRRLRLLVRPDTNLRWHRDLLKRVWAPGRPYRCYSTPLFSRMRPQPTSSSSTSTSKPNPPGQFLSDGEQLGATAAQALHLVHVQDHPLVRDGRYLL
jgi:hypothetical protein